MSFVAGTAEGMGIAASSVQAAAQVTDIAWKAVLGGLVGIYGLREQVSIQREQLTLAKRGVAQADEYLDLAQTNYTAIARPTYDSLKAMFDRYESGFAGWEKSFVREAFRLKEFNADYITAEGRALGIVQRQFDRALKQRQRQAGAYNTGRCAHDAAWFSIMAAQAKADTANRAFRFEEERKRAWDEFYWRRLVDGVRTVSQIGSMAVSGLSRGNQASIQGLGAIGQASSTVQKAVSDQLEVMANGADTWGSVANGGFQFAGHAVGASAGQQSLTNATRGGETFANEHSLTVAVPFSPVAAYY